MRKVQSVVIPVNIWVYLWQIENWVEHHILKMTQLTAIHRGRVQWAALMHKTEDLQVANQLSYWKHNKSISALIEEMISKQEIHPEFRVNPK